MIPRGARPSSAALWQGSIENTHYQECPAVFQTRPHEDREHGKEQG